MSLREWFYNKRYHLFKTVIIDGIKFSFYWKLEKTIIVKDRAYLSIRKYSDEFNKLQLNVFKEYRACKSYRIMHSKRRKL